jgi:hypothetical protein
MNFAGWAKKVTGAPTISVGSVGLSGDFINAFGGESSTSIELDKLIGRMEREEFDLIAVGRALITDPDWVSKVRDNDIAGLKGYALRRWVSWCDDKVGHAGHTPPAASVRLEPTTAEMTPSRRTSGAALEPGLSNVGPEYSDGGQGQIALNPQALLPPSILFVTEPARSSPSSSRQPSR